MRSNKRTQGVTESRSQDGRQAEELPEGAGVRREHPNKLGEGYRRTARSYQDKVRERENNKFAILDDVYLKRKTYLCRPVIGCEYTPNYVSIPTNKSCNYSIKGVV
ncbi:hypothetical protein GWI33_023128 [Rhynchophorus ferrugineus]|uniref:Uncharacterized protein n=1 Tax=Rhynchophorus ferrugineus TaxID=354439 RepID=A0A834M459_RHYFE|nr:hypothetical protein GWI33_023129 [Rhynchophorus ferrugineus]KAF7264509.1 hypothetical protein GWI33_023128 [Rhynchophorus ferrugineus]